MKRTILMLACLLVGCTPPREAQVQQNTGPTNGVTRAVDATCNGILSAIKRNMVTVSRDQLERLADLAKADPKILASPATAAKARSVAARDGDWPVIEHNGKWFVLENHGHPASDGFFRVSVVDITTTTLMGSVSDTLGTAPIPRPANEKTGAQPPLSPDGQ